MEGKNKINVRRLVGASLLTIFALGTLIYAQALFEIAWVGIIRQYQHFLYFYAAWAVGLAIWYFVTIKSKPIKKAEIIVKIIFFFVIALNAIYAALLGDSNATFLAVLLMICYAAGCPWGKLGYKKHPYNESTSEPTDSQHSSSLPWYKTWWAWLVIVATIIFVSGAFIIMTDGSFRNSDNSTDPFEESHKSAANTINVDYKKYKIKAVKTYNINYTDKSWDGGSIKINKIKIYQTAKPYKFDSANDGNFKVNGFARIYMTIKAQGDINIYPTQGTYNYSNGEQHEVDSSENWDGKINADVIKSGTVTLPIEHLSSTSSIKNIRMKFEGYDQDEDDDSLDKDFDFTVDLK